MQLSLQQKEQFFHELKQSIKSGISFPKALERKAGGRSGALQRISAQMLARAKDTSAAGYFAAVPEVFSDLDRQVVSGGEAGGRLDSAMGYLSEYYGALAKARHLVLSQVAYPLVLLHLGAILLSIPAAVQGGFSAFLTHAIGMLLGFYVLFFLIWLVASMAMKAAQANPAADSFLQSLPAIGGTRVALIGSRFCMLMGLLVKTGKSILGSLETSAKASGSALFTKGATQVSEIVRGGGGLGQAIMSTHAFPDAIDRAFQTGEESGRLDEEMQRQAERFSEQFSSRLNGLSVWLPRILYGMILAVLAWKILEFWFGYFATIRSFLD